MAACCGTCRSEIPGYRISVDRVVVGLSIRRVLSECFSFSPFFDYLCCQCDRLLERFVQIDVKLQKLADIRSNLKAEFENKLCLWSDEHTAHVNKIQPQEIKNSAEIDESDGGAESSFPYSPFHKQFVEIAELEVKLENVYAAPPTEAPSSTNTRLTVYRTELNSMTTMEQQNDQKDTDVVQASSPSFHQMGDSKVFLCERCSSMCDYDSHSTYVTPQGHQKRTGEIKCSKCQRGFEMSCRQHHRRTETCKKIEKHLRKKQIKKQCGSGQEKDNPDESTHFLCDLCPKTLRSGRGLREHMKLHSGKRKKETKYLCEVCSKVLANRASYRNHIRIHTGEKPFKCMQCPKTFSTKSNLNDHMHTKHSDLKPYSCPLCSCKYKNKNSMDYHIRSHRGLKPFKCPHCSAAFTTKYQIPIHIACVHSEDRPWVCVECSAKFSLKKGLQRHMVLHTGKPFQCPHCVDRKFARASHLRIHMLVHSKDTDSHMFVPTADGLYQCSICHDKVFKQKSRLRIHFAQVHNKGVQNSCVEEFNPTPDS